MKKILLLLTLLLISFSCIGQNNPAPWKDGIKTPFVQLDTITTTERDALTIPSSASSIIYNSTVDSVQYKIPSGGWKSFGTDFEPTTTIVGITGTKAEFDTAVTDGDILYVGDVTSNATHTGEVTGATALTIASSVVDSDNIVNASIDEVDLDASINAALTLAVSSTQPSDNISTLTNDEAFIQSDDTGRTASTEYTNLYGQTQAGYTTDGAPAAGTLVFITDASPADSFTGTVIPLDSYYQHDDSGTDTATWTLAGSPQNGALVEILINEGTEPTITGATQITNSPDFIAATPMILTVKHILGTTYYFFTEL